MSSKQYDLIKYHANKYLEIFPEDQEIKDLLILINNKEIKRQ